MTTALREGSAVSFLVALQKAIAAARSKRTGTEAFHALRAALETVLAEHGAAALRASADDEEFRFNEIPVSSGKSGRSLQALLTLLANRGIAELRFSRALNDAEIATFAGLFHVGAGLEPVASCRKIVEGLWNTGLRGTVDVISLEQYGLGAARAIKVAPASLPRLAYARLLALVSEFLAAAGDDEMRRHLAWRLTKAVSSLVSLAQNHEAELLALAQVRGADVYMVNHAVNTCVLSVLTGKALQLSRPLLAELGFAALLCWSGKLRTDPAIVNKPASARTPQEAQEFARHHWRALATFLEFRRFEDPLLLAGLLSFQFDARRGSPPMRAPIKALHPLAQIVALAESFDAQITAKPGVPHEALGAVITDRYDSTLVQVFKWLVARMAP